MTEAQRADATDQCFSGEVARQVVAAACLEVGLDPAGASLMRLGENALFRLAHDPIVARVARSMEHMPDARKEVAVAAWLAGRDFPAVGLAGPAAQPIEVSGHPVTFWRFIDGLVADQEAGVLGSLLRRLHRLPGPRSFRLPALDIMERVQARVEAAPVADRDKRFLLARLDELGDRVGALTWPLDPSVIHGDAHDQNVMIEAGRAVLIDFERFAWGQPEWDLAVSATEYLTGGWWSRQQYAEFVDAYGGFDVTEWPGFAVLRATNELKMTTWIMQNVRESEEIADEFAARMHTLRTGELLRPWRPF